MQRVGFLVVVSVMLTSARAEAQKPGEMVLGLFNGKWLAGKLLTISGDKVKVDWLNRTTSMLDYPASIRKFDWKAGAKIACRKAGTNYTFDVTIDNHAADWTTLNVTFPDGAKQKKKVGHCWGIPPPPEAVEHELKPGFHNPTRLKLEGGPSGGVIRQVFGTDNCGYPSDGIPRGPSLRLRFSEDMNATVEINFHRNPFIITPDGSIVCKMPAAWKKGEYQFYPTWQGGEKRNSFKYRATIYDKERLPTYPEDLPVFEVTDLKKGPMRISGKRWPRPDGGKYCASKDPDPKPVAMLKFKPNNWRVHHVELDLWQKQRVQIVGPLEKSTISLGSLGNVRPPNMYGGKEPEGTYLVHVADEHETCDREFEFLMYEKKHRPERWFVHTTEVPEDLPVDQRTVKNFAPFFTESDGKWTRTNMGLIKELLEKLPKEIILFTRKERPASGGVTLAAGEPVFISYRWKNGAMYGFSMDGLDVSLSADDLTRTPEKIVLPAKPRRIHHAETYEELARFLTKEMGRDIKAFEKKRAKSDKCFDKYWAKRTRPADPVVAAPVRGRYSKRFCSRGAAAGCRSRSWVCPAHAARRL